MNDAEFDLMVLLSSAGLGGTTFYFARDLQEWRL
jgi:hypothetical protein